MTAVDDGRSTAADHATLYPVQGGWDGYARERQHSTEAIAVADLDNVVTLTGDVHCFLAGYKQLRYDDALGSRRNGDDPERLGVEPMTPALTSLNVAEAAGAADGALADLTRRLLSRVVRRMNPHIEHFDSHHGGTSPSSSPRRSSRTSATPWTRPRTRRPPSARCWSRSASRRARCASRISPSRISRCPR